MTATDRPHFQQLQYGFAAHIRDPGRNPPSADVEERRMQVYCDLFYNNVDSFLTSGFPVLRSLLSDTDWHTLVRDFFSRHRCHTPYFLEISQEFLRYLQTVRQPQAGDFPFLLELAHYEWLELAVDVDPDDIPLTGFDPGGDLLTGRPVLSPLAHVAAYDYPVHTISRDNIPTSPAPQPVYLIVYRNRQDQVQFMEINAVTARLLLILQDQPAVSGLDALEQIVRELHHPVPDQVIAGGQQALETLRAADIVLGAVPVPG